MDHPAFQQGPSSRRSASPLNRHSLDIFDELGRVTISLREEEHSILLPSYRSVVGAAKAASRLNKRLQHRLEIDGGSAGHLGHVGGGGLWLERLPQLVKQPDVLDGDDGLRGEILDQICLLIVEGSDLLAIDSDRTNQVILLEHRHDQKRPSSGNLGNRLIGIFRSDVGDVCDLPRLSDAVEDTSRATRRNRIALAISGPSLGCIVERNVSEYIAFVEQQVAEAGLTDANSVLKHSLEHWPQFTWRIADDLEHVGGGGLLLQRLAQLVQQPRVLDGDDGLLGEIADQLNLLIGERSYLLTETAECANQLTFFEHWYANRCPLSAQFNRCHTIRIPFEIGGVAPNIGTMGSLLSSRDLTQQCVWSPDALLAAVLIVLARHVYRRE